MNDERNINDNNVSYTNESIKNQIVEVMCLVHEDDVETEYEHKFRSLGNKIHRFILRKE